ncbi:MAG: hypothetical protein EZS28_035375 [Streblomastix strix]|uniref:Uncharacterized protein n=1 Tax=Streblomastix strix TaxID=222440 RepID=A0A5J4UEN3_9EUKA|nr:MAG: hypothetical protein EZS28_035375 [Streblomastix strix]
MAPVVVDSIQCWWILACESIRATSNFDELNPITGTSQCYGIVSSSYLFKFILSTMRQKILIANIIQCMRNLLQYVNVPYNAWPPLNPLPQWSIYLILRLAICVFNDGIVRLPPPAPACGSLNTQIIMENIPTIFSLVSIMWVRMVVGALISVLASRG